MGPSRPQSAPFALPSNVLLRIFNFVAEPQNRSAYWIPLKAMQTLCTLTLVSKEFRSVVLPVLHRRVYLTPKNLPLFRRTLCKAAYYGPVLPQVEWLAIAEFPDDLEGDAKLDIIYIIHHLPDSVQHVLFDVPFRHYYGRMACHLILEGLEDFTNLRDLISTRDELYLLGWHTGAEAWGRFNCLRRLAVYNVELEDETVFDALKGLWFLRDFCVLNLRAAWWPRNQLSRELASSLPRSLQVTVMDAENDGDEDTECDYLSTVTQRPDFDEILKAAVLAPGRISAVNVDALPGPIKRPAGLTPPQWLLHVARSGYLWQLKHFRVSPAAAMQWLTPTRLYQTESD